MRTSLLTKLLVPSFALFAFVMLFVGAVSQREAERAITATIMRSLESELRAIQASVDSVMLTYEQNVSSLARFPLLITMLDPTTPEATRLALAKTLDVSLRNHTLIQTGSLASLNVLNEKGVVIVSSNAADVGRNMAELPASREALAGKTTLGFPLRDGNEQGVIVPYAFPVMVEGHVVGAVLAMIHFDKIAADHIAPVRFGEMGHAFMATTGGYILYHPDAAQIMVKPESAWLTPAMTRQGMGVLKYTWRNQPWMALFETSPLTGWTTIVKVQEDELFAPARASRWSALGSIAIAFVVFAAIMFMLIRHVTGALRRVVQYAEAVAGGDLTPTLDVRTNDEIGVLADALRHMVDGLRQLMAANSARTAEAEQSRLLAEDAMNIKERFLARVSHEIRTPMNAIIGFSHLCLQNPLPPQPRAYINSLHSAALELLKLVNELLDFSGNGKDTEAERVPFSLGHILHEIADIYEPKARARGLNFTVHVAEEVPDRLLGDPLRLRQVLTNLLENAIKFTEQGFVSLSVTRPVGHPASPERVWPMVSLLFEVADSGIGMSMEQLERLSEGFSQADTSFTRRYGGLGLGLPLARRFVENMGGRSFVSSKLGEGSAFSFMLCLEALTGNSAPPGSTPAANVGQASSVCPEQLAGRRVLLVEDNIFNQQIAIELLQQYGVDVSVANNGQEALELLNGQSFDLILMDIQMPVMDGLEASRLLRAKGLTIPIVALTAHSSTEDREQSRQAGMNVHLTKPVNPDELLQTLLQWMAVPGTMADAQTMHCSRNNGETPSSFTTPTSSIMEDTIDAVLSTSKGLSHVAGNKNLYIKLLGRFLQDHTNETQKILASLAEGDAQSACRMAHTMKSVAATLGADSLSAVAKQLEMALREAELPDQAALERLCAAFNTQLQRTSVAIKVYLHSEGVPFSSGEAAPEPAAPAPTGFTSPSPAVAVAASGTGQTPPSQAARLTTSPEPSPVSCPTASATPAAPAPSATPGAAASPFAPVSQAVTNEHLSDDDYFSMVPDRQSLLLVDDSPEQLIVLEEILGAEHDVHLAASGTEALTYLEEASRRSLKDLPDLILLDVLMPGLDGYTTCQELKKIPG